jgi:cobalamin biosynthesis protein CobD/CbiB
VNSGYSESLISGGLGTWFGGPVRYFGIVKENPIIGLGGGSGEIWMLKKMEILIYCIGILMGGALWLGV